MGLNTPISGILIKTRFLTRPALKLPPYLDLGVVESEMEGFRARRATVDGLDAAQCTELVILTYVISLYLCLAL